MHMEEEQMRILFASMVVLLCMSSAVLLQAYNGHTESLFTQSFIAWLGSYHLLILHFPIALIVMTLFAEGLSYWTLDPLFDAAARFMMMAAAVTIIPTALLGLAFSYSATYGGELMDALWWHRLYGLVTTVLVVFTVYVREYYHHRAVYYTLLLLSFISVFLTGYYGGKMTFGPFYFLPPIINAI